MKKVEDVDSMKVTGSKHTQTRPIPESCGVIELVRYLSVQSLAYMYKLQTHPIARTVKKQALFCRLINAIL